MRYIEDYYILHPTGNEFKISGGEMPLIYGSTMYAIKSLGNTLNFIDSWLQPFKNNYSQKKMMYINKVNESFKKIIVTIP